MGQLLQSDGGPRRADGRGARARGRVPIVWGTTTCALQQGPETNAHITSVDHWVWFEDRATEEMWLESIAFQQEMYSKRPDELNRVMFLKWRRAVLVMVPR